MLQAQLNHFKQDCSFCEREIEPEHGVVLMEKGGKQAAYAAYHRSCLHRMLDVGQGVSMVLGRDGVWSTPEDVTRAKAAEMSQSPHANVPPKRKPGVSS